MTVYYLPIEPYPDRYTWQLRDWTETRFQKHGVPYITVLGKALHSTIKTGSVLDAHGRSHYALTQTAELVRLMDANGIGGNDVIYLQDMFHPGYEAIPYITAQLPADQQ